VTSDPLVVRRWTRYGKDRLYVETDTGEKVGFLDLLTGQATIERTDLTVAFHEAVSAFQGTPATPEVPEAVVAPVEATTGPLTPSPEPDYAVAVEWSDLALNRPGQGVRAEAESLLPTMDMSMVGTFLKRAPDRMSPEMIERVYEVARRSTTWAG
jgi:hypothetical protein